MDLSALEISVSFVFNCLRGIYAHVMLVCTKCPVSPPVPDGLSWGVTARFSKTIYSDLVPRNAARNQYPDANARHAKLTRWIGYRHWVNGYIQQDLPAPEYAQFSRC